MDPQRRVMSTHGCADVDVDDAALAVDEVVVVVAAAVVGGGGVVDIAWQ